jgi:DNA adenine methylase
MTAYHGGKARGGKEIAKIITSLVDRIEDRLFHFTGYWEPFCGMCGVYRHIPALLGDRSYLASDIHPSLILMWQALQEGWHPPKRVTKQMYNKLKTSPDSSPEKAYVGFGFSFAGIYFNGKFNPDLARRMPQLSSRVMSVASDLRNVRFKQASYEQIQVTGWVIYCDPPYEGSSNGFKLDQGVGTFSSDAFWIWARHMSRNNLVLVSEYDAPDDFIPIYQRKIRATCRRGHDAAKKEFIFIHESWL